jgi:hypothetical protein
MRRRCRVVICVCPPHAAPRRRIDGFLAHGGNIAPERLAVNRLESPRRANIVILTILLPIIHKKSAPLDRAGHFLHCASGTE